MLRYYICIKKLHNKIEYIIYQYYLLIILILIIILKKIKFQQIKNKLYLKREIVYDQF